jgi:hypothetical protein
VFEQFALVNAVLAGLAFAYFGALLALPPSRAGHWAIGCVAVAAASLVVSTLGGTFVSIDVALGAAAESTAVQERVGALRGVTALGFALGLVLLLASLALGAWQRSRPLGGVVTAAAVAATVVSLWMFARYL